VTSPTGDVTEMGDSGGGTISRGKCFGGKAPNGRGWPRNALRRVGEGKGDHSFLPARSNPFEGLAEAQMYNALYICHPTLHVAPPGRARRRAPRTLATDSNRQGVPPRHRSKVSMMSPAGQKERQKVPKRYRFGTGWSSNLLIPRQLRPYTTSRLSAKTPSLRARVRSVASLAKGKDMFAADMGRCGE
jgi:hypothetical protein